MDSHFLGMVVLPVGCCLFVGACRKIKCYEMATVVSAAAGCLSSKFKFFADKKKGGLDHHPFQSIASVQLPTGFFRCVKCVQLAVHLRSYWTLGFNQKEGTNGSVTQIRTSVMINSN